MIIASFCVEYHGDERADRVAALQLLLRDVVDNYRVHSGVSYANEKNFLLHVKSAEKNIFAFG